MDKTKKKEYKLKDEIVHNITHKAKERVRDVNKRGAVKVGNRELVKSEKALSLVKGEIKKVMKLLKEIDIKCVKPKDR